MTPSTVVPEELLTTTRLKSVHIEVTSRCNLRCTYCAVSQLGYKGYDLSVDKLDTLLDELEALQVETLTLNGHGETTFHKQWTEVFQKVIGRFPRTELTTNLAMDYTDEEIDLLAELTIITVSIDTHDPLILRDTRRKVDVGTVLKSIARIRKSAERHGRVDSVPNGGGLAPTPHLRFSCVVHDKNVHTLPEFAHFAVSQDVKFCIFCNMIKYDDIPGALNVYPVTSFETREELEYARDCIQDAEDILRNNYVYTDIQAGLLESLEEKLSADSAEAEPAPTEHEQDLSGRRSFAAPQPGETRDCLDPWQMSIVYSTGKLSPCCWIDPPKTINEDESFTDIVNSETYVKIREQLLTGELNKFCRTCPARAIIDVDTFRDKVADRDITDAAQREGTQLYIEKELARLEDNEE